MFMLLLCFCRSDKDAYSHLHVYSVVIVDSRTDLDFCTAMLGAIVVETRTDLVLWTLLLEL